MRDDPNDTAQKLIDELGLKGAIEAAVDGITEAHQDGDNYQLSVWRDIRRILNEQQTGDQVR